MRIQAFVILLLLQTSPVLSQTINTDSLRKVLYSLPADSTVIKTMLLSGQKMANSNYDAKLMIYKWGIEKSETLKYFSGQVMGYRLIGLLHRDSYNNSEATEYILKAIELAEKHHLYRLQAQALDGLSGIYRNARDFPRAFEYQRKAIEVHEKTSDKTGLGSLYFNLGALIHDSVPDQRKAQNNPNVFPYLRKGIRIAEEAKDSLVLLQLLNGTASVYAESGIFDTATQYLSRAEEMIRKLNVPRFYSSHYLYKGNLYRSRNEYATALSIYKTGLETARKNKDPYYERIYYGAMSKTSAESGDTIMAYRYFQLYSNLSDSLLNEEKLKTTAIIDGRFQKEKKDNEINRLTASEHIKQLQLEKQRALIEAGWQESLIQENELALMTRQKELQDLQLAEQQTVLQKNRLQAKSDSLLLQLAGQEKELKEKQLSGQAKTRNFLIAGIVLLSLLSFILYKNIMNKRKAYRLLQDKSEQIRTQALQLGKQAKLIAQFQSQMNPHFVYNALHNIQGLVLSDENKKANTQIQSLAQLMRKTFSNAEKDDIPLEEEINYLQKYIEFERTAFEKPLDFLVKVDKEAEQALIPPMMIQPFVENAIKHAGLTKVNNPYIKVLIQLENNLLSISVRDNGLGIQTTESGYEKLSHSMSVIKSRLDLIFQGKADVSNKAVFAVKTIPEIDSGTLVKFYLPLNYNY